VVCGVVYGGFLLAGAPILTPLAAEGDLWSAGDLPYVIEAIFGITVPPRLSDAFVLLVLLGIFALIARAALRADIATRMRALTYGMAALTLAFLVFSKKSWPPYLMLALFPVCLLVVGGGVVRERWKVAAFALFSVVSLTEHSYWASSLAQFTSAKFHQALLAGEAGAVLMLLLELLLIAGYLWLLWEAVSRLRTLAIPKDRQE
jgi:hypothetical protein